MESRSTKQTRVERERERERELESVKHEREIIRSTRDAIKSSTSTSGIRAVVRGSRCCRSETEGSRNNIEPVGSNLINHDQHRKGSSILFPSEN